MSEDIAATVRRELATLRPGATMCPGELARRVLPGTPDPLGALRPWLAEMERSGEVRITQRGRPASLETLRGPFRVSSG